MTSETRRQSTDELLALIDSVVSGHENQHSDEWALPVPPIYAPGSLAAYIDEQLTTEYQRRFWIEAQRLIVGDGTGEPTGILVERRGVMSWLRRLWQPFWLSCVEWFAWALARSFVAPPLHHRWLLSIAWMIPGAVIVAASMALWTRGHGARR